MEFPKENNVEKAVEKPQTPIEKFWGNLEKAVDDELSDKKKMDKRWDSLVENRHMANNERKDAEEGNKKQDEATKDAPEKGKNDANENTRDGLTEEEKLKVKEKHPDWPDEIIDAIGSWKEYEIYDKANLKVEYINGRPCLIRTDIDMEKTDVKGRTNRERMEQGLSPLDNNGRPIELHHIGQKADSPLAELTFEEHHSDGNFSILHDASKETEVHGEGNNWKEEREDHWKTRSAQN